MNGTLNGRGAAKITTSKSAFSTFQFSYSFEGRSGSIWEAFDCSAVRYYLISFVGPVHRDNTTRCAMAKGEGGEQYSNASLLNKPVSPDGIKLARKVSGENTHFYTLVENVGEV